MVKIIYDKNAKTVATRVAYGNALADLGDKYNFFVLDADLSGSTQTAIFGKKFPDRFINCGIAESNMISVAAGIAASGVPAFASSFAMFACGRAYEQIRNSVAYPELNVKICASHAGVTVGEDGATHQFNEDIAIMRSMPQMTVVNPADATEAYAAVEAILNHYGPVYMRLGRFAVPVVFEKESYKFELGKGVVLADGSDVVIFATGIMNAAALDAREMLKAEGIDAAVVNIHTIKPIDKEIIIKYAEKTRRIVTAEEHSVIGGLGSAVADVTSEYCPTRMARVGIEDVFGTSGKAAELLDYYNLNAKGIVNKVKSLF
ncbi:MAG TPA: transketolase family protein [Bacillota bacterium]|nr:transketolase family protein [Bacillota bacterium]HPP85020.1 transketolase family protein [Bacillota bacterium]